MKAVCAIALGGLLVAGCGGSGFGLSAGNRKPSLTVLDPTSQPDTTSGVVLTPDIADEKPGSCTVDWILYVWDGNFAAGEPSLTQVQTAQTTGEAAVTFPGLPSGWYTVDVTVRDDEGETATVSKWDFTTWCSANGFGQCALLPVKDPSDTTDPTITLSSVALKGTVSDGYGAGVVSMTADGSAVALTPTPPASGAASAAFDTGAITITGTSQTIILRATDAESPTPNVSTKDVTITQQ